MSSQTFGPLAILLGSLQGSIVFHLDRLVDFGRRPVRSFEKFCHTGTVDEEPSTNLFRDEMMGQRSTTVWLVVAMTINNWNGISVSLAFLPKSQQRKASLPLHAGTAESESTSKKIQHSPSSRSTAAFALFESSRKKSAIALRILENDPNFRNLEFRDRAFARMLLSTVERRQGQIDKVIGILSRKRKGTKVRSS